MVRFCCMYLARDCKHTKLIMPRDKGGVCCCAQVQPIRCCEPPLLHPTLPAVSLCSPAGRRGGLAAKQLADAGLSQVVNLEGGLAKWSDLDLPHTGTIKRHH